MKCQLKKIIKKHYQKKNQTEKPTSEELDKAKVGGDQIDKKPEKPTEEDTTTPKTALDTLNKPGEEGEEEYEEVAGPNEKKIIRRKGNVIKGKKPDELEKSGEEGDEEYEIEEEPDGKKIIKKKEKE